MDEYQEKCSKALKSMNNEDYSKYYGLYLEAQRGQITWKDLWEKHLKCKDSRVHIRDIIY